MIYFVALLLILALVFEALFLKKGLKSAKKNSAYLRSDHAAPLSSRSSANKRVKKSSATSLPEVSEVEEVVPGAPEDFHNVVELSGRREGQQEEAGISSGVRHAVTSPAREKTVHDMIQEIRGSKLVPEADANIPAAMDAEAEEVTEYEDVVEPEDYEPEEYEEIVEYEELPAEEEAEPEEADIFAKPTRSPVDTAAGKDTLPEVFEAPNGTASPEKDDAAIPEEIEEAEIVPSPEELLKAGIRCVRQGNLDEGISVLEQAVASAPEKAEAHFNLGIAYTLQEFQPSAIRSYQRAIEIDPQYGKAFFNLGTLFLKQGNVKDAIKKLEQAVKFLDDPMKALWNLYEAYRSSDSFTKALSTLERLIELEPDDASLHNHLGICYVKLGKYEEAIDAWKRSVSFGASSRLIFYNLGKTYELCGETDEAVEQYEHFLQLNSNDSNWTELVEEVQGRLESLRETVE